MPAIPLPSHVHLDHLRKQAKLTQRAVRAGEDWALALVAEFHPRRAPLDSDPGARETFRLADAQHTVARHYGFPSWPALRKGLAVVADRARSPHRLAVAVEPTVGDGRAAAFIQLACLNYGDDSPDRRRRAATMLAAHPDIAAATIHTAACVGDVFAIERALAADPGAANREGGPFRLTPLLYLAFSRVDGGPGTDPVAAATRLLDAGADPNAGFLWEGLVPPFTVLTGLFGEGEQGPINQPRHPHSRQLVRLLLDAGADPNDGQTLYNRMFRPDDDHLEVLLPAGLGQGDGGPWKALLGDRLPSTTDLVQEVLERAVEYGFADRVARLLAHGVDPERTPGRGSARSLGSPGTSSAGGERSLVRAALLQGRPDIASLLTDAGAQQVDLPTDEQFLAACTAADANWVDQLLTADPGLVVRLSAARPELLIEAAERGQHATVRLLAELGFDVNARRGRTALHEAAWHGDVDLARLLVEAGADHTATDESFDSTPLGWAEHAGQERVAAYLRGLETP